MWDTTGLQSGETYAFRVYAKDAAGNLSKPSNAVTVTLPGQLAGPTKPIVGVQNVGPTHATLNWSSTDDGPFIWYTIYIDGQPVFTANSKSATFYVCRRPCTHRLHSAESRDDYTFIVNARDVDGNFPPLSDPVFVTTDAAPTQRRPATDAAGQRYGRTQWRTHHRQMASIDRRSLPADVHPLRRLRER